jgi:hypothetical protein
VKAPTGSSYCRQVGGTSTTTGVRVAVGVGIGDGVEVVVCTAVGDGGGAVGVTAGVTGFTVGEAEGANAVRVALTDRAMVSGAGMGLAQAATRSKSTMDCATVFLWLTMHLHVRQGKLKTNSRAMAPCSEIIAQSVAEHAVGVRRIP